MHFLKWFVHVYSIESRGVDDMVNSSRVTGADIAGVSRRPWQYTTAAATIADTSGTDSTIDATTSSTSASGQLMSYDEVVAALNPAAASTVYPLFVQLIAAPPSAVKEEAATSANTSAAAVKSASRKHRQQQGSSATSSSTVSTCTSAAIVCCCWH
jgi:hypothetical protein